MSAGGSQSQQSSSGNSFISQDQLGFLNQLWNKGMNNVNPTGAIQGSAQAVGMGMPGTQAGLSSMAGLAANGSPELAQAMTGLMGMMGQPTAGFADATARLNAADRSFASMSDPTAQIAADEGSLKAGLDSLWKNTINPSIRGDAMAAGGFGGGRQGVAEGVAAGELGNTYATSMGDIQSRARASAQSAIAGRQAGAGALAAMGLGEGQYRAGLAGQLGSMGATQAGIKGTAASQTTNMMGQLQQILMGDANAGLSPLLMLGQILGNPAILSQQSSKGSAQGFNFGWGE